MISLDLSLRAQTERYLLAHQCSDQYARQLRKRSDKLTKFAGGWLRIDALTCDLVNDWLITLARGLQPPTVDGYRRAILSVWNDAYLGGFTEEAPLRVRKVKVPHVVVTAYTLDEIRRLLDAAQRLPGSFNSGLSRAAFWEAAILAGYESGLRRGDLLALPWDAIAPDGRWSIVQQKTGHDHIGKFSPRAIALLASLPRPCGCAVPFPIGIRYFGGGFRDVRKLAGIKRGSFKWLRRAAGSYADKETPGNGPRLLGHTDGRVFRRYYEDRTITNDEPLQPPPL